MSKLENLKKTIQEKLHNVYGGIYVETSQINIDYYDDDPTRENIGFADFYLTAKNWEECDEHNYFDFDYTYYSAEYIGNEIITRVRSDD